jgi:hypothetical protein
MIPGGFTNKISKAVVASAATIAPLLSDYIYVTGTTTIATIGPPLNGGFNTVLFLVPATDVLTTTTGNIAVAVTMPALRVTVLLYDKANNKWYPGAIS